MSDANSPLFHVKQVNLVSDQTDAGAANVDPNLVNAWGLAFGPTGIAWISDNGTGLATLYAPNGAIQPLVVTVPTPGDAGGTSAPTGMVFNPTTDFANDKFIMSTEDGTVAGWQNGTMAAIRADNSAAGAVYKGLALISPAGTNLLVAANFSQAKVDVFDRNYQMLSTPAAFIDGTMPAGFAPFNVVLIGNAVVVTYALQSGTKRDDVAGLGNGFVNIFDTNGRMVKRLVSGGNLNSPWGVAVAPATFGPLANMLLVGNFGDGRINVYNPTTGQAMGQLGDATGAPLAIPGLWTLLFETVSGDAGVMGPQAGSADGGTPLLFFTAGPSDEMHGLFGRLDLAP